MAPSSRGTTHGHRPNGLVNGAHDPPPSTMAAQLINNLSVSQPLRQVEKDDLQSLMAEVSDLENNSVEYENADVKVQHKHKLIYVFSCAVLERLGNHDPDPFMNVGQVVAQTSDALDVFMSTISENPGVLDYVMKPEETLHSRGQEPLWIWLFPKVLTLLGRKECEILTEKINYFFHVSFQAVSRSPRMWNLSSFFFSYLKECATTLLGQLQNPSVISQDSPIRVVLPSNEFDYSFFSHDKDSPPTSLLHCTYVVHHATDGLWHITNLLSTLVDISTEAELSYNSTPASQDYLVWMMDSFLATHDLHKRWRERSDFQQPGSKLEKLLFGAVHALISALRDSIPSTVLHKAYALESIICADLLERPTDLSDNSIQLAICGCLLSLAAVCKEHDCMSRIVSLHLLGALGSTLNDESGMATLGNDFKKAGTYLCQILHANFLPIDITGANSFENVELNAEICHLDPQFNPKPALNNESESGPIIKRRKVSTETHVLDGLVSDLYSLLSSQKTTDLDGLSQVVVARFTALNDADRCKAIQCLGNIPCAANGTLAISPRPGHRLRDLKCSVCDGGQVMELKKLDKKRSWSIKNEAVATFCKLIQCPAFVDSRRPRVLAIFALRRFAAHFHEPNFLDLEESPLAQWCVKALRSSVRELRIAASRTLPMFLCKSEAVDPNLLKRNRHNLLDLLRSFSETEPIHFQETCILAWAQMGKVLKDDELSFVLLALVKYLGHSNPVISAVAFNEILHLSKSFDITVDRMLGAFWDILATEAVKDLLVRPQATQLMADLLGISVSEFLVLTQTHTLPWLVLNKNIEVIRRISRARQDENDWAACFDPPNLVSIMALLLQQSVPDMEAYIMSLLKSVSPRFEELHFTNLMRVEPAYTAFYLLRAAGEAEEGKKSRIRLALQFLASRAYPIKDGNHKKTNAVGVFLEQHILGLVARLSDTIYDPRDKFSITERKRCIKACEELVRLAKAHSKIARPQICACLQSAVAIKDLQVSAFSAWQALLMNLDDDDVEVMLESTFSTIIQHWRDFNENTRKMADETLRYLLENRANLIRNTIVSLASLSSISELADVDARLKKIRTPTDTGNDFQIFSRRIKSENSGVVIQALVELKAYLGLHQSFLQASAVSEQPDVVVGLLVRSVLDTCVKFNDSHHDIAQLSAECIGLIGCLDANRVESIREQREMVVVSNFHDSGETTDFALFVLEEVIVPAFLSTTDTSLQGFFSYVMQELLEKCNFKDVCGAVIRSGHRNSSDPLYKKWLSLPGSVQDTLTPFLNSKYRLNKMNLPKHDYPIFRPGSMRSEKLYNFWLRALVLDLLQKPFNPNAELIYLPLSRAIRIKDVSVASFLLPYVVLHVIVEGTDQNTEDLVQELLCILKYETPADSQVARREDIKLCVEAVFRVLDYLSRWVQERERANSDKIGTPAEVEIHRIKSFVERIPAEVLSQRAIECKSYSRALYYWEQHIRLVRNKCKDAANVTTDPEKEATEIDDKNAMINTDLLERLQDIYIQIDEPDGIEGISAHLHVLDIEQQILGHRKAGRWTAAQSWYEIKLAENPKDLDVQLNLLTCLKESGQHDVLLNYVEGMNTTPETVSKLLPFATEASWATGRWNALEKYVSMAKSETGDDFNTSVGQALLALHRKNPVLFKSTVGSLRERIACSLSEATTSSISTCHDTMLKLHVLTELEMIEGTSSEVQVDRNIILDSLNRRLEVIGAYLNDKQYLLGIRRAVMQLSSLQFTSSDIASAWLTSARLARKGNAIHQSFNAVLHASKLGDESAKIEHARLLWKEGHHRKAIQSLQGAIDTNAFISHSKSAQSTSLTNVDPADQQNLLTARAHLLLAKWLDNAGQTNSAALRTQYQLAARTHTNWEKGHYYLGRHYNKMLESEKIMPPQHQKEIYLSGEIAKLVIENYLRALSYGTKYLYQTLPRILTLWLDLGTQVNQPVDAKYGNSKDFASKITSLRKELLDLLHTRFHKYINRMPAYIFYTALPQIVARIAHPNAEVYKYLQQIIFKVVLAYPQHSLWTLLAVCTSKQVDRKTRGIFILASLRNQKKTETGGLDIRNIIKNGEKLAEQLLCACTAGDFQGNKNSKASLSTDLGFNQKISMPSLMAVPIESVLTATLPTLTDNTKTHKAFSRDVVTISSIQDEVLVLSSLQKPRKLTTRGSDGRSYGLMCKPKDDLRKDQRLMEFNSMINRSLKRDAESSRRQLYIKTYAVTPLNEECGLIEWVDGLKTLRDILLGLYKAMGIQIAYREIEAYCDEAVKSPAKLPFFTEKVLGQFPPVFHKWFVQQFPEPSSWFAARLRYTRSCAVMSMVGTILGLGDRHGENILFEEGNGGTFHVDFNCLFDKGLTFAKPERVPFRLTHNMVDAMGMYGYEGPFRKSSELTLKLLRQHQETLMTILESFIYDPTLDLLAKKPEKKKKESPIAISQTAQGVLDSIQRKVKGHLPGESVPLGVEGQADELIKQATNQTFLAGMYIGWCPFF